MHTTPTLGKVRWRSDSALHTLCGFCALFPMMQRCLYTATQPCTTANVSAGAPVGRPDALFMDAPISFHWPKLLLWSAVEGLLVATSVLQIRDGRAAVAAARRPGADCRAAAYRLQFSRALVATTCTLVGLLSLYLVGTIFFLMRGFAELRKRSYRRYRVANTFIRVQVSRIVGRLISIGVLMHDSHQSESLELMRQPAHEICQDEMTHMRFSHQARLKGGAMGFFAICIAVYIFVQWGSTTRHVPPEPHPNPNGALHSRYASTVVDQLGYLAQLPSVVVGLHSNNACDHGRDGRQHVFVDAQEPEGEQQHPAASTTGAAAPDLARLSTED